VTLFTGPIGAMLYVLGCREPLRGTHEQYVAAQWRQTLGSTMHCVAGDGVGILAGAVIGGFLELPAALDITMEYVLGFGFGLGIFQALFMRDMVGGSYPRALARSLVPELTSMNCLMAGMIPVAMILKSRIPGAASPLSAAFWFVMSMALMTGFIAAYPMNWWLVARRLKHGMLTVRRAGSAPDGIAGMQHQSQGAHQLGAMPEHSGQSAPAMPGTTIAIVIVLSFLIMTAGIAIGIAFS
jgi:hypothetical protein